jgi:hypothetical protein
VAATSSTSSSSTRRATGFPSAFVLTIVIVIAFELYLRTRDAEELIAYPELGIGGDQTVTYKAVREYIALEGAANVALVGSSQMRENVVMPRLIESVRAKVGRDITVRNYATRGARADVMNAVVDELLDQPVKPDLIVIGVSVRDLRTQELDLPRLALFWDTREWLAESRSLGWSTTRVLPTVVRNELGRISYTLRFRDQLAIDVSRPLAPVFGYPVDREPNPIVGEVSWQHMGGRGLRNLVEPNISPRRMLNLSRESYAYQDGPKPSEPQTRRLQSMIRRIESADVRAVLVEMPVADYLENDLAARKLTTSFDRSVRSLVAGTRIRYITTAEQPFQPGHAHFVDLQHLNRPGAELFGDWLAEVIAEGLSGSWSPLP